MVKSICVFCASSNYVDDMYKHSAIQLADVCIKNQIHVLYGGGYTGLMGALADRILQQRGKITGIIPQFMVDKHWVHEEVEDRIVTPDMRERKRRMIENVDAVVALPGGVGTLEELVEVITLKQLERFSKPIVIVNTNGFYNPLVQFFDEMIALNFMREQHRQLWEIIDAPEMLFEAIARANHDPSQPPKR